MRKTEQLFEMLSRHIRALHGDKFFSVQINASDTTNTLRLTTLRPLCSCSYCSPNVCKGDAGAELAACNRNVQYSRFRSYRSL